MVEKEIDPIPDLPSEIIQAIENEKLVIFIGAGVSRLMGCKGWDDLARDLVRKCYELECINYREQETLEREKDHKKTITVCYHLLENNHKETFFEVFNRALEKSNSSEISKIYEQLNKLNAVFVTTNADCHFDEFFLKERVYWDESTFEESNLETRKLFHIHGSQKQQNTLVFTVDAYIQRYKDEKFKKFLEHIFDSGNWTVLFMGYGLSEFELLDYVIGKSSSGKEGRNSEGAYRHFALLPYYREEVHLKEIHQLYYNHLGIKILAYRKDERGYDQLYYVVRGWYDRQIRKTNLIPKEFKDIEGFVNSL
jgi:hypothetical protein